MYSQKRFLMFDEVFLDDIDLATTKKTWYPELTQDKVTPRFRNGDALYKSTGNPQQERLRLLIILSYLISHYINNDRSVSLYLPLVDDFGLVDYEKVDVWNSLDVGTRYSIRIVIRLKKIMTVILENKYGYLPIIEGMEQQYQGDKMALALFQDYVDYQISRREMQNLELADFADFADSLD